VLAVIHLCFILLAHIAVTLRFSGIKLGKVPKLVYQLQNNNCGFILTPYNNQAFLSVDELYRWTLHLFKLIKNLVRPFIEGQHTEKRDREI